MCYSSEPSNPEDLQQGVSPDSCNQEGYPPSGYSHQEQQQSEYAAYPQQQQTPHQPTTKGGLNVSHESHFASSPANSQNSVLLGLQLNNPTSPSSQAANPALIPNPQQTPLYCGMNRTKILIELKYKGVYFHLKVPGDDIPEAYRALANEANSIQPEGTLVWKDSRGKLNALTSPDGLQNALQALKKGRSLRVYLRLLNKAEERRIGILRTVGTLIGKAAVGKFVGELVEKACDGIWY